jgi:hypothetical protein
VSTGLTDGRKPGRGVHACMGVSGRAAEELGLMCDERGTQWEEKEEGCQACCATRPPTHPTARPPPHLPYSSREEPWMPALAAGPPSRAFSTSTPFMPSCSTAAGQGQGGQRHACVGDVGCGICSVQLGWPSCCIARRCLALLVLPLTHRLARSDQPSPARPSQPSSAHRTGRVRS